MSDDTTAAPEATEQGGNSGFTPPATQEEFNRIIAERVSREKAKYSDYGDLKSKATRFDELSEAQKSEVQKAVERAETAEKALQAKESEALRLSVIAKHQIPEEYQDLVVGADQEELEKRAASVAALVAVRSEQAAPQTVRELMIPGEGKSPATALNGDGIEAALRQKLGIA